MRQSFFHIHLRLCSKEARKHVSVSRYQANAGPTQPGCCIQLLVLDYLKVLTCSGPFHYIVRAFVLLTHLHYGVT